jgi:ParB-like chromosome segregation protein Spo0J
MQQSEMKVEYWDVERLIPYVRNPRKNDQAVPKMAGVIKEFGFVYPILVRSDGEVVDGHLRLKTAHYLGMKKVPVEICDDWTPAQVKAFRIAVNKSAEWAEWDDELLQLELDDLSLQGFDLDLIGFENKVQEFDPINFEPGTVEEQGKLDELSPKMVTCPHCGEVFDVNKL